MSLDRWSRLRRSAVLLLLIAVPVVGSLVAPEQMAGLRAFAQAQGPIVQTCNGAVSWANPWGAYFIDASVNCDNDLDRAGVNGPDGVDAMDFDGDCDQDIITGWEENGRVFVYLNPRLRERPVLPWVDCPKAYPAATGDDQLVYTQWPFSEVTRDDTSDSDPFRGVEDAIFVDNDADGVSDYVVISTEIGADNGRKEVFVSVPTSVSSTNYTLPRVEWTTFSLTGEENYMRAAVGDLDQDGCLDIIAGSKSAQGTSGDIRWWQCPKGQDHLGWVWTPEIWKHGLKADMRPRSLLRERWGNHRMIADDIHWVMEMVVTDLETGELDGKNHPELVFSDRNTVGYFRVVDPEKIDGRAGWQQIVIDSDTRKPFRWLDVGQLTRNGPNKTDGLPEIVVAYTDPAYSATADSGIFARWYEYLNGGWRRRDVVLEGRKLPWTYHSDNTNKATALADLDGDGANEIVASIRGLDYSSVFYLTPPAGRSASGMRCVAVVGGGSGQGGVCGEHELWVINRISPHFQPGEVKADNLALVDLDLDCDIDVASVDENFGTPPRGLGVSWYANTVAQTGSHCNKPPAFVSPDLSPMLANEGTRVTRDFLVTDPDAILSDLKVTVAPGSPGNMLARDRDAGLWRWRYTPPDGVANPTPRTVRLLVSDGWAHDAVAVEFDLTVRNVPPTLLTLQAAPSSVIVGQVVTISATFSDPAGSRDTYSCRLVLGDGTTATIAGLNGACTIAHAYTAPGVYTVFAFVSDEDGGSSQLGIRTVVVTNAALAVSSPTFTPVIATPLVVSGALSGRFTFTDERW